MGTVTVENIANEFLHILGEGWTPDLEEFLSHVPQEMRAECRERIEELTGAAQPEPPAPPPPSGPRRLTREEARRMFAEMGV